MPPRPGSPANLARTLVIHRCTAAAGRAFLAGSAVLLAAPRAAIGPVVHRELHAVWAAQIEACERLWSAESATAGQ